MARGNSVTVDPSVGWAVDNRGYIHGGFDTPVFRESKHAHNSRLTSRRNSVKKKSTREKTSLDDKHIKEKS